MSGLAPPESGKSVNTENWTLCETGLDAVRLVAMQRAPGEHELCCLRTTPDADVFLGALCDASGEAREWLELWVQRFDGPAEGALSNGECDARWRRLVKAIRATDEHIWWTGAEGVDVGPERSPTLLALDRSSGAPIRLADHDLTACRDEEALVDVGGYARSERRYLWSAADPASRVAVWDDAASRAQDHLRFNIAGGYVLARRFAPFDLVSYSDALDEHRALPDLPGVGTRDRAMCFGRPGQPSKALEALYLRLSVFRAAIGAAKAGVQRIGQPLLTLTPESFAVRCDPTMATTPWAWTASVALVDGGCAKRHRIGPTDEFFGVDRTRPADVSGDRIFRPHEVATEVGSSCAVRFRAIDDEADGPVARGTLVSTTPQAPRSRDLARVRFPSGSGAQEVWIEFEGQTENGGECRFVTRGVSAGAAETIRASLGVEISRSHIEVVPRLSSACDLYSLGVIGARMLLAGSDDLMPETVDELHRLGRAANGDDDASRIMELIEGDAPFEAVLGARRLSASERAEPGAPPMVWWPIVSTLTRFLPGLSRGSYVGGLGQASTEAPEGVFAGALADMDRHVERLRSLLFIDWAANREVHRAARRGAYLDMARHDAN